MSENSLIEYLHFSHASIIAFTISVRSFSIAVMRFWIASFIFFKENFSHNYVDLLQEVDRISAGALKLLLATLKVIFNLKCMN